MKIGVLGCGLRTPLLLHGLLHCDLAITQVDLFDTDPARSQLMAQLGTAMTAVARTRIAPAMTAEQAIAGCDFVISSVRVGNMQTRAADERLALECSFAGQETTGPAGFAMALRTIPVALAYARVVERIAPEAWIVNFTNPAGIIAQAISTKTAARVIGICDTPAELFFQIARALGEPPDRVRCDYFGLNHLGWVRSVEVDGTDAIGRLMNDDGLLRRLYPAELFHSSFLRTLGMLPTEYLFYYYNQQLALKNQRRAGVTRGEELHSLNQRVWADLTTSLHANRADAALQSYRLYLNRRNVSYMRLDAAAESAFQAPDPNWDPFEGATGYHRIAVNAIRALTGSQAQRLVLNVPNRGGFSELEPTDIVEMPCMVDRSGARLLPARRLPESVRGLVVTVKEYERMTIRAAIERRWDLAALALTVNPIVGNWNGARTFLQRLADRDQEHFAAYGGRDILQS
jgi:6-phospho-beta-glucosidase